MKKMLINDKKTDLTNEEVVLVSGGLSERVHYHYVSLDPPETNPLLFRCCCLGVMISLCVVAYCGIPILGATLGTVFAIINQNKTKSESGNKNSITSENNLSLLDVAARNSTETRL